jgi:DNA-binding TFAR19-related protein (PDSD5 family)
MLDGRKSAEVEFEALKRKVLRKILTKGALERLGRVRLVNPILVAQLENYLLHLYQTGQLKETVDDRKLKQILNILIPKKKKTKIKRK